MILEVICSDFPKPSSKLASFKDAASWILLATCYLNTSRLGPRICILNNLSASSVDSM